VDPVLHVRDFAEFVQILSGEMETAARWFDAIGVEFHKDQADHSQPRACRV